MREIKEKEDAITNELRQAESDLSNIKTEHSKLLKSLALESSEVLKLRRELESVKTEKDTLILEYSKSY